MRPIIAALGRALQLLGLGTITFVIFLFFTQASMDDLLKMTILGLVEFYGGTWILGMGQDKS